MNVTIIPAISGKPSHYDIVSNDTLDNVGRIERAGSKWFAYHLNIGPWTDDGAYKTLAAAQDSAVEWFADRHYCAECQRFTHQRLCPPCSKRLLGTVDCSGFATDGITGGYADLLEYGDAL